MDKENTDQTAFLYDDMIIRKKYEDLFLFA